MSIRRQFGILGAALLFGVSAARVSPAQEQGAVPSSSESESAEHKFSSQTGGTPEVNAVAKTTGGPRLGLMGRFLLDQRQIWTSPAHLRWQDANWLVPLGGLTEGLITTDADLSRHISHNPTTVNHYNTLSNGAVGALLGGAGAMWVLSYPKHNEHWRETGFLAGEAVINSFVVVEAMKYPLGRQRPNEGNGNGEFFHGGVSFPSEHAAAAWAAAGVVAHEYPGPLTKIVVYSLASLVDYSRYRARQHFPSDVFIGSVIGNLVAEGVYTQHPDVGLDRSSWVPFRDFLGDSTTRSSANMGSPNVPLDSWIYPALDRLAALGYVRTAILGMRPWTRLECVRQLDEAGDLLSLSRTDNPEATSLYEALTKEFSGDRELVQSHENRSARLESAYTRVTGISGTPLADGYIFGQTLTNDFGRPYQEGFNSVVGMSGWATSGPLVSYGQAEYQHAPSAPALPLSAREFMYSQTNLPSVPPDTPIAGIDRVQLLDAYFGLTVENWEFSYGKQSLWWGPSQGGPFLFSNNSVPVNMFRLSRVSPFKLPSVLGWLGPMSFEWLLGQLSGTEFVYQVGTGIEGQFGKPIGRPPFIQGEKFSFKPTPNFEFSVAITVLFSGGPVPLTMHYLLKSYSPNANLSQGAIADPGDGRSGIDFVYKVPGLRNWLTFYGNAFTEDEFSPLGYPRKSAFQGGLYMPHIPGIPKLDLRMEGGTTSPVDFPGCDGCFYVNNRYPNGYTNSGNLIGSSLGRGSQGEQAWSTYWFSPRSKIQFSYRHQKVDVYAVTGGGTINDGGVQLNLQLRPNLSLSGLVQYEKWNYPVLANGPQSNVTTSIGIAFTPIGGRL
jgi:membrane-associated phospholipid phosphatase